MSINPEHINTEFSLESGRLFIKGSLLIKDVASFLNHIRVALKKYQEKELIINLDGLTQIDSGGVTAINYLKDKFKQKGCSVTLEGGSEAILAKMDIFTIKEPIETDNVRPKMGLFESIGDKVFSFVSNQLAAFLYLMADVFYWSVVDIFNTKAQRKGEFYNQAVLIGVNAVAIVSVMSFIIGLVLALQSAAQLRNVGANIFIVDLTVIAMMREMGPLITAILVAGRSGSAIAAEIATMKVTSELDALKTMALNPVRFVVVPKMHGGIVTMPLLTILANVMGILGGILVAYFYLDISVTVFINRMGESLQNRDILIGFLKSLVFAALIVLTGSYFGFRVDRGAEGVGKVTTLAVVVSISLVIIADSIMGLIFY